MPKKTCLAEKKGRVVLEPLIDDGYYEKGTIPDCPKFREVIIKKEI